MNDKQVNEKQALVQAIFSVSFVAVGLFVMVFWPETESSGFLQVILALASASLFHALSSRALTRRVGQCETGVTDAVNQLRRGLAYDLLGVSQRLQSLEDDSGAVLHLLRQRRRHNEQPGAQQQGQP